MQQLLRPVRFLGKGKPKLFTPWVVLRYEASHQNMIRIVIFDDLHGVTAAPKKL